MKADNLIHKHIWHHGVEYHLPRLTGVKCNKHAEAIYKHAVQLLTGGDPTIEPVGEVWLNDCELADLFECTVPRIRRATLLLEVIGVMMKTGRVDANLGKYRILSHDEWKQKHPQVMCPTEEQDRAYYLGCSDCQPELKLTPKDKKWLHSIGVTLD